MSKKSILFVDDERNILKGLRRMLYPLRGNWSMFFVESGAEALETMEERKVDVVISDMRMPGMDGFELLQTIRKEYPEVVRVMLTGQPDQEMYHEVMKISHYFLWKPVKFEEIEAVFGRVETLDSSLNNEKLIKLIGGISSLPSLPTLYRRLTQLLEATETDAAQIAAVVEEDMAMAVQILKLVNSAFLGLSRRIETLQEAIAYLGLDMVRSLVLVQHLFSQCSHEEHTQFQFDVLWKHSFCTATVSRKIAAAGAMETSFQDSAYLAGLLHDIGKLILAHHLPDVYREILVNAAQQGRNVSEVEMEVLGADHAQIGAYLTSLWGLPRVIIESVALHHKSVVPDSSSVSPVLGAVWHANRLCNKDFSQSAEYLEFVEDFE